MKAVFLDRDGVINKFPGEGKYVTSLRLFKFLPRVKTALRLLTKAGFKIFVISNQAGVSKRVYSRKSLDIITKFMLSELSRSGIKINKVYYCTHQSKDNCSCRKPKAGMVQKAVREYSIPKSVLIKSFFIGDTIRDVYTAGRAGLKSILVFSGKENLKQQSTWEIKPDYTAKDLSTAVKIILKANLKDSK